MTAELVIRWSGGELDLMGWNTLGAGDFKIDTLADGTDWGNPEPVRRSLRRFLLDGSSSVKEYDDNRTIPLSLRVTAPDGVALAQGEQALDLIDGRRCELVWTPPDPFSPACVFIVDFSDLRHKMDDIGETRNPPRRFYSLTLSCLPHAYSADYVTIPAVPQDVSTPIVIDDLSSLTGWSSNGTLELHSSPNYITANGPGAYAIRSGTVDFTAEPFLSMKVYGGFITVSARSGGGPWETLPRAGFDQDYVVWDTSGLASAVVTELRVSGPNNGVSIQGVRKQATRWSEASQQQVRTIATPGSRRAPASILVESPTTGLGTTLIYSGAPYNPDLTIGALGTRFPETTLPLLTGSYSLIANGGTESFDVLASSLPEGSYSIWVRALGSPTIGGTLTIAPKVLDASGVLIATLPSMTVSIPPRPTPQAYSLLLAGSASLPYVTLPAGSDAKVRFDCSYTRETSGEAVLIDALLAFNRTLGTLTIADVGTRKKLWIESPSLELDRPSVFVGSGEKSSAVPLSKVTQLPAWGGAHSVTPPDTYIYSASTSASDVEVSGTFRPASLGHPTS